MLETINKIQILNIFKVFYVLQLISFLLSKFASQNRFKFKTCKTSNAYQLPHWQKAHCPVCCSCRLNLRYFHNFPKFICFSHLKSGISQPRTTSSYRTETHPYACSHISLVHTYVEARTHTVDRRHTPTLFLLSVAGTYISTCLYV